MSKLRDNTHIITDKLTQEKNLVQYNKVIRQWHYSRNIITLSSEFNDKLSCERGILY